MFARAGFNPRRRLVCRVKVGVGGTWGTIYAQLFRFKAGDLVWKVEAVDRDGLTAAWFQWRMPYRINILQLPPEKFSWHLESSRIPRSENRT